MRSSGYLNPGVLLELVVLVADALQELFAWRKLPRHVPLDRFDERSRIFDRHVNREVPKIGPAVPLDDVKHLGMRIATSAVQSQLLSLSPTVSTTSVSFSHLPIECPIQVGSGSAG